MRVFPLALAAAGIATLVASGLLVACSTASGSGQMDGGGGGGDATSDQAADGTDGGAQDAGGDVVYYPPPDAPLFAPDGCAYLNVPCIADASCCSGYCSMNVCAMQPKMP